jgi:hypothetical protein
MRNQKPSTNTNMKNRIVCLLSSGGALVCLLGWSGCAAPQKKPVFQAAGFSAGQVNHITVLPVADLRPDKSVGLNVNRVALGMAKGALKQKKYKFTCHKDERQVASLKEEDLEKPDSVWIKTLEPAAARWVMILAVNDLVRKVTFGTTGNAEVSAYLFDKQSAACVWHDKGLGQSGQGGLIGYAMPSATTALQLATHNALAGLPKKPR